MDADSSSTSATFSPHSSLRGGFVFVVCADAAAGTTAIATMTAAAPQTSRPTLRA
jgi:hypothetical protein